MTGMEPEWQHYRILFSVASVALAFFCLAAATAVRARRARQVFSWLAVLLYVAQIAVWGVVGPGVRGGGGTGLWLVILLVSFLVGFIWLRGLFKEWR